MRRVLSAVSRSAVVLTLLVFGAAGWAHAGLLDPLAFPSLGAFPSALGTYSLSTTGTATLNGPGGTFTGVVSNGVAVFDFDSINVVTGQVINGTGNGPGSFPVAFLSRSDITVNGPIDVSGGLFGGPGGFGGGNGLPGTAGSGPGGGGAGELTFINAPNPTPPPTTTSYGLFGGGGGGGFGGPGNAGMPASVPGVGAAAGGSGGRAYANLLSQLQGGSGGAVGFNLPGGGGGGAIELGAVGKISVTGSILANGGSATSFFAGGGGGGAGGGILLHGDGVTLSGPLSAVGGNGGPGGQDGRNYPSSLAVWGTGGHGGGGQVVIDPGAGGFTNMGGTIDVGNGSFSVVPEPANLVLLGIGLLGMLGYARYATRRADA